jgi:hypothetical protein
MTVSWRSTIGAVLATATAAALVVIPFSSGSAGAPGGAGGGRQAGSDVRIDLVAQNVVVQPQDTFRVEMIVSGAPPGAKLRARLYPRIGSRADFGENLFGQNLGRNPRTLDVPALDTAPVQGGGGVRVTLEVPICPALTCDANGVSVRDGGVYPVQIRVDDADDDELTQLVTFMVRLPDAPGEVTPLLTSVLFDQDGPPLLAPDGKPEVDINNDISPLAILTDALDSHPTVPVTVAPTPEMIETIEVGTDDLVARLAKTLKDSGSQVIAGTYVDVPTSAWVANGQLDRELGRQRSRGTTALEALPEPDVGTWVAEPTLDEAGVAKLLELGVKQLVIDSGALSADRDDGSRSLLEGPFKVEAGTVDSVSAVQIDPGFRGVFSRTGNEVLDAHRLIAELATVAYESPDEQRGMVVAPPADWTPNGTTLDVLLEGLDLGRDLIRPATVNDLFAEVPPLGRRGEPTDDDEETLRRRLEPMPPPDLGDYPGRLNATRFQLDSYQAMIGLDNRSIDPYEDRLLASAAVELSDQERDTYLDSLNAELDQQFKGVDVPNGQTVTLTSSDGQLPITVRNLLDIPVTVEILLRSSERLEFPEGKIIKVELEANETRPLKVQVKTRATGDTPIQVSLQTPGGARQLQSTRYNVRSTAVSGVGLFLTVGAAGFLALWWIRHIRLTRRERRQIAIDEQREDAAARAAAAN